MLVRHHDKQTDIIFRICDWTAGAPSLVYMATFRPFTVTWGALMKSSKCQTIREPRSPSRLMRHSATKCWWSNDCLTRQTSGPRSVEASEKKSANRIMATHCDFVGFVAQWRWNTRSYGFRLREGFKTRQVLLKVNIKKDWQGSPMCSDRRSCHSLIDAQRTWVESSEVKQKKTQTMTMPM